MFNSLIQDILDGKYEVLPGHLFDSAVTYLSETYSSGQYPNWPTQYGACKSCEFRATPEQLSAGKKSGFQECMVKQHALTPNQCKEPTIFEIWNFRSKVVPTLLQENRLLMAQLSEEFGLPVIDGVTAGVTFAEALVNNKLSTSKSGAYSSN